MFYSTIPQKNGNLRPHQIKAKDEILHAWDNYDSIMLQMPTGTGKTFLFTSLISDILDYYKSKHIELNILIVAHRTELLEQIASSLGKYGIPFGFIQGSREQHLWQRIQVGSIMSLLTSKNESKIRQLNFNFIIVDEAHHSLADTYKRLFEIFPKAKKLGVTATPWRLNHETFTTLYQSLITAPQISWFIKNELLANFDYVSIKPNSDVQKMIDNTEISSTGDFVNIELERSFNTQRIRSRLFSSYLQFANGRKGIVYAINKEHAANIANMYNSHKITSVAIDCDTPKSERTDLVDAFKNNRINILVNVDIFTEGFDCPNVSFIQLARPTRSLALYLQQVGRGLRIVDGKEKTIIIDNVGLYNYFGLPDANRFWNYHFNGHEIEDEKTNRANNIEENTDGNRDRNYEEDDEEMMVIRDTNSSLSEIRTIKSIGNETTMKTEEFSLCNYYLIRGNNEMVKVYPFIKKNGVLTKGVSNIVLDIDMRQSEIVFSNDTNRNIEIMAKYPKIQTVVMFAANLCGIRYKDVLNLRFVMPNKNIKQEKIGIYELLKLIQGHYEKNVDNN